jgi:hypothetical protein
MHLYVIARRKNKTELEYYLRSPNQGKAEWTSDPTACWTSPRLDWANKVWWIITTEIHTDCFVHPLPLEHYE